MGNNSYEMVKDVLYTLLAGEIAIYRENANTYKCGMGIYAFMNFLKEKMPEIFKDKEFTRDLIWDMPGIRDNFKTDECILEDIYWTFLDKELQNDPEILWTFLSATRFGYEDPDYLEYGKPVAGIPFDIYELSHDMVMGDPIFSLLLKKTDPVSIYEEILNEKERLDPEILRRLIQWYGNHLYLSAYANNKVYENMVQLQGLFVDAICEDYRENEKAAEVYDGLNPYVSDLLSELTDEFLDSIRVLSKYGEEREWEKPVPEMMELFKCDILERVQTEIDFIPENAPGGKEERAKAMEDFSWIEAFEKLLSPYMEQIKLFDAAFEGDFGSLGEESKPSGDAGNAGQAGSSGSAGNSGTSGQSGNSDGQSGAGGSSGDTAGGGFMDFPDDDDNLPF